MKPHDFDPATGTTTCARCGKASWHEEHFGGDRAKAAAFYRGVVANARTAWAPRTGVRVQAVDTHPRDDIAGRSGVVTQAQDEIAIVTVHFDPDVNGQVLEVGIPVHYLQPVPLSTPPRFSSVEEAEAWMEQHAAEMGIELPKLPPRFTTQEEADEWLRQQAGEPYVPLSWQPAPPTIGRSHVNGLLAQPYSAR